MLDKVVKKLLKLAVTLEEMENDKGMGFDSASEVPVCPGHEDDGNDMCGSTDIKKITFTDKSDKVWDALECIECGYMWDAVCREKESDEDQSNGYEGKQVSKKSSIKKMLKTAEEEGSRMSLDPTQRVIAAIDMLKEVDPSYYNNMFNQRLHGSPNAAGSTYEGYANIEELISMLKNVQWESYNHPSVRPPAVSFKANLPGRLGLVEIDNLPDNVSLFLDDRKRAGTISLVAKVNSSIVKTLAKTDFTVIMLGPADKDDPREIVWTFHPGDPVRPNTVDMQRTTQKENKNLLKKIISVTGKEFNSVGKLRDALMHGISVTKKQAHALGYDLAKVEESGNKKSSLKVDVNLKYFKYK